MIAHWFRLQTFDSYQRVLGLNTVQALHLLTFPSFFLHVCEYQTLSGEGKPPYNDLKGQSGNKPLSFREDIRAQLWGVKAPYYLLKKALGQMFCRR